MRAFLVVVAAVLLIGGCGAARPLPHGMVHPPRPLIIHR